MFQFNTLHRQDKIFIGLAILAVLGTLVFIFNTFYGSSLSFVTFGFGKSYKVVAQESVDYINKNLLQPGTTAVLQNASKESGVIKMNITINGQSMENCCRTYEHGCQSTQRIYASECGDLFCC